MSGIKQLCAKFYNNPIKSFEPREFRHKSEWNYSSVKKQLTRLEKEGIIKRLSHGKYILANQQKALDFIESKSDSFRSPSLTPPNKMRLKAHDISIGEIDLSGEPLEWLLKLNMLTKPNPRDPARNVGLRKGQTKKFNMRISLRTGKAKVYPKSPGWDKELLGIFSWCGDFINRLVNIEPNIGIAINYDDLKRINSNLARIPFEDVKGMILEHNGMKIQLCASQFKEGEICIHTNDVKATMSLTDKVTHDLSRAIKETAFEKAVYKRLEGIEQSLKELPFSLATLISGAVQEGIEKGFEKAFNNVPQKPDDKIDVI